MGFFSYTCIKHKHKVVTLFLLSQTFHLFFSKQVKCVWAVKSLSVGFTCLEEILVTWWPPIGWCLYIGVATHLLSVMPKTLWKVGLLKHVAVLSFFYELIIAVVASSFFTIFPPLYDTCGVKLLVLCKSLKHFFFTRHHKRQKIYFYFIRLIY